MKTPFRKKLSSVAVGGTENTTTCTHNKKIFYDKNGNEIVLNHINSGDVRNEMCEVYIMEDDKGNIIKARKRIKNDKGEIAVDNQGNAVVEYIDDNGNEINVSKYKYIKKAEQQLISNSLNNLFNEHNSCDVFEVLDNEGKIIQVRKVYKSTRKNNINNTNQLEQDSEDNIEYIDLNGNAVSVQKIVKQITKDNAALLLQSQQEELHKRNKTNLEQAIKNSTADFNENNNLKTPIKKSSQNNNDDTDEDKTTNSHYYPKTARSKLLSSSMSHYYIPAYKSLRDNNKYKSHSKASRNRFNEEQCLSARQKKLFFRVDHLPLTGSFNKSTFISSPEDIIIPVVEHDPKDKFYIRSSNPVKIVHPPNSMRVSSFGFFK